jgi:phospholipid transport system substrate-binding protein
MDTRVVLTFALVLTLAPFTTAAPARAGEPTEQLRQRIDRVVKILQDKELASEARAADRRAAVRKVALEIFDFEETAKRALGRHWRERTPAEQQDFLKLFTDLLEESYIGKIEGYQGEKITYAGDTIEGDLATVRTRIITPKAGSEIPVDYRMLRQSGGWRVYDVIIEGVSLVANYRTQFNKVIQTASFDELMKKMRAKGFSAPAAAPRGERRG